MLANVLPGLREVRAPLVAGYAWLGAAWILGARHIPLRTDEDAVWKAIYRLLDGLGPVGGSLAISLGAYIVGAISVAIFDHPLRRVAGRIMRARGQFGEISLRGFRSLDTLASHNLRELEKTLEDAGRSLSELEVREDRDTHLASLGFSPAEVQRAEDIRRRLDLSNQRVPRSEFETLAETVASFQAAGVPASEVTSARQTELRLGSSRLSVADVQRAADIIERFERTGLTNSDLRTLQEIQRRLDNLRLDAEELQRAEEIDHRLTEAGVPPEARANLKATRKAHEDYSTIGETTDRDVAFVKSRLEELDLSMDDVYLADEVRMRAHHADMPEGAGRLHRELSAQLGRENLTGGDILFSESVMNKLASLGMRTEEIRRAASLLGRVRQKGVSGTALDSAVAAHDAASAAGVTLEDAVDAEKLLQRVDAIPMLRQRAGGKSTMTPENVVKTLVEELNLLSTRLIGKESELFSAVDRIRAEAEFRLALVPPALFVVVVLANNWSPSWLLTLPLIAALYLDGVRKHQAAGDLLADALLLGRTEAPSLERLHAAATTLISRTV